MILVFELNALYFSLGSFITTPTAASFLEVAPLSLLSLSRSRISRFRDYFRLSLMSFQMRAMIDFELRHGSRSAWLLLSAKASILAAFSHSNMSYYFNVSSLFQVEISSRLQLPYVLYILHERRYLLVSVSRPLSYGSWSFEEDMPGHLDILVK